MATKRGAFDSPAHEAIAAPNTFFSLSKSKDPMLPMRVIRQCTDLSLPAAFASRLRRQLHGMGASQVFLLALLGMAINQPAMAGSVSGTIQSVMAGNDSWYGVRFYLNIASDQTNDECNPMFVYTEPEADSGHKNKVAVFTAAYLSGKSVVFTVAPGRGGFCKLIEGQIGVPPL